MKLLLSLATLVCLFVQSTRAQSPSDELQYFDAKWRPAKEKKAIYLLRIRHVGDTSWQYSYYNMYGPLVRLESYQDRNATTRHGLSAWYNKEGDLDSSGYYDHGIREGEWFYPAVRENSAVYYEKGRALSKEERAEKLRALEILDWTSPDFASDPADDHFPGGKAGWMKYLNTHLHYPDRAVNNVIGGNALVLFLVDETGKVRNAQMYRSVELSLDDHALEIINGTPGWAPFARSGKNVRAYLKKPVRFQISVEK